MLYRWCSWTNTEVQRISNSSRLRNQLLKLQNYQNLFVCVEALRITLVTPATVTIIQSETLEINVSVTGVPQPNVTWRKDNEILDDDLRFTITGSNLRLLNVQPTDAGEYTITAQNIADTEVKRYTVIVQCE